jgi:hypothetical protein
VLFRRCHQSPLFFRRGLAVWLSKVPTPIPGDLFCSAQSAPAARAAFEGQAASDWQTFLSLRGTELRTGGCLMVALPGRDDDGKVGVENLFLKANETLAQMIDEGTLSTAERARMVLGCYVRHKSELLAPFENGRQFQHLRLEDFTMFAVPDAARDLTEISAMSPRPSAGLFSLPAPTETRHTGHMKTDLDKALEIVNRHGSFVGRNGTMRESIALAVAEGITLGRKEGIAMAMEALARCERNEGVAVLVEGAPPNNDG